MELCVRVYKTREFAKWAAKEKICDRDLMRVIDELEHGLAKTSLGGGLYKKSQSHKTFQHNNQQVNQQ